LTATIAEDRDAFTSDRAAQPLESPHTSDRQLPGGSLATVLASLVLLGTHLAAPNLLAQDPPQASKPSPSTRWEADIARFERQDRAQPTPRGAVLFVGSSSIRLWDLPRFFPDVKAVNRGFGGSEVADSLYFADRIILPYRPKTVVVYAGDNDIAKGKSAAQVARDFDQLVARIHEELPESRIVYIAIKPSVKRWEMIDEMRQANRLILETAAADPRLIFVDIDEPMIGADGRPRPELFQDDGLHLNDAGYKLWTSLVAPHLN